MLEERDEYNEDAVYFPARLRGDGPGRGRLAGSARLIRRKEDPGFEFPCRKAYWFRLRPAIRDIPVTKREEVGRMVSEMPAEVGMG